LFQVTLESYLYYDILIEKNFANYFAQLVILLLFSELHMCVIPE